MRTARGLALAWLAAAATVIGLSFAAWWKHGWRDPGPWDGIPLWAWSVSLTAASAVGGTIALAAPRRIARAGAIAGSALGIAAVVLWTWEWTDIGHLHGPHRIGGIGSTAVDTGTMDTLYVDARNTIISGRLTGAAYAAGCLMVLAALLALATLLRLEFALRREMVESEP